MKSSIIILSWNTKELLEQCLRSLASSLEIIVVDNGSSDGSSQMVEKEFPMVKLIKNETNLGFAKGNNLGVKRASGDLILFLNSDTIVKKGAVEKLADFLKQNEAAAAVSPLVLNHDGSIQKDPCYLRFPSLVTTFFYYNKFLRKLALKFFPFILLSAIRFEGPVEVDHLPGAAMMIKKEILDKIRGFDESYPLYFEDVDLCYRIKKLGYKLVVVPEAKIVHLGRKSIEPVMVKEGVEKFYFLNFNSLFLFCEKNYSSGQVWLIKLIVFFHLALTLKFGLIKKLIKR